MSNLITAPSAEAKEIARILGIDITHCTGFDLSIHVGSPATIVLHKVLAVDGDLKAAQQLFNLVPVEKPE